MAVRTALTITASLRSVIKYHFLLQLNIHTAVNTDRLRRHVVTLCHNIAYTGRHFGGLCKAAKRDSLKEVLDEMIKNAS